MPDLPGGKPEFATNDPGNSQSQPTTVGSAINEMLNFTAVYDANPEGRSGAIASAYFNVGGWQLIAEELKRVGNVRLLLGAEPHRSTDPVVLRNPAVPARRAAKAELATALEVQHQELAADRDLVPFTAVDRRQVAELVAWARTSGVEVRRYTREFLHGKAYLLDSPPLGVIAGSSNFTYAGLAVNRELNLGQYNSSTIHAVRDWFDGLWVAAEPFDLATFYEHQIVPDEPWLVFLRMLWEAYGVELNQDEAAVELDPSLRNLMPFQKDGVTRARRILDKHNGVLIADEVGLGKTYVGGALVKDTVRSRQRVLIIAPKVIRDSVWKPYIDREHLGGWVDVISYDDLLAGDASTGNRWRLPIARDPAEYSMVLLDEAHTVRNTDTQRARALVEVLSGTPRKHVVLLTATPVNNALGDLHSLLSYFIAHDDEFTSLGIPSLAGHFRAADRLDPEDMSPEHLFDILDAVAVRRTRRFVRSHYVGQQIERTGEVVVFPDPEVRRVDYQLGPALDGFFESFAHALGADSDPEAIDPFFGGEIPVDGLSSLDSSRLTLAGYTPTRYQNEGVDNRQRAAEASIAGLLRSGLLKRFESSGFAFIQTCRQMASTQQGLLDLMQVEGLVASGASLRDWIRVDTDDFTALDDWRSNAEFEDLSLFQADALAADIASDISLLNELADRVAGAMESSEDPKLAALRETLVTLVEQARAEASLRPDYPHWERDCRKVLIFSYFTDTIAYIQANLDQVLSDQRLLPYRDRVAFVSGGRGARAGFVDQEVAVAGFAPRTGGALTESGLPLAEDRFDIMFSTDVLSEGVNLQQAHNIINFDLPWNPMRLVQRHGRVDRIGSQHEYVYLWCFFPDTGLDRLLGLEEILHRKLRKAAVSIGHGVVLPGVAASDERLFNAKSEQIRGLASGDAGIFLGSEGSLISGEEFRATLRSAVASESLEMRLLAMPWGVGSGFTSADGRQGLVFCARVLDQEGVPLFRFVPLQTETDERQEHVARLPKEIVGDTLTSLMVAQPPATDTPTNLPDWAMDLAYQEWDKCQEDIVTSWNDSLDSGRRDEPLSAPARQAVEHLLENAQHRNQADVDAAIQVYRRSQAARVNAMIRDIMRDEALTGRNRSDRLIELIDDLGLQVAAPQGRRFPITRSDVHLIAWMAIVAPGKTGQGG